MSIIEIKPKRNPVEKLIDFIWKGLRELPPEERRAALKRGRKIIEEYKKDKP
jgi:hypothetical protein